MVGIYFDESRNTGEIGFNKGRLNYYDQRYFILVGVIDSEDSVNRYKHFKEKNLHKVKTKYKNNKEIKGTDLLRRDNNQIFDEFLDEFIGKGEYLITIYDKKYFLVTQLILWLLGEQFKIDLYDEYLMYCELLHKVDDIFLIKYIEVIKDNSKIKIQEFMDYILKYEYKECIGSNHEQVFVSQWKTAINTFVAHGDEYISLLEYENYENVRLFNKDRNNIVNLTALGETILIYKHNNPKLKNKDIQIYHDEINMVQQYIGYYWKEDNLNFVNSENEFGVQLADNIASIIGNLTSKFLPLINDNDLGEKIREENSWNREKFKKIINNHTKYLKLVMTMRERAALMTYIKSKSININDFKEEILINLECIFAHERENNMTLNEAIKILKK